MSKTKSIIFILIALIFPIFPVLAQDWEAIPGQESVGSDDLTGYLENLYNFGISITGILAIFMIAVGAFAYIVTSAGNASKMMDAKEKITNALIGLVIALTAYLFLYVINPDLVGGTLETPGVEIGKLANGENSEEGNVKEEGGEPCSIYIYGQTFNKGSIDCTECEKGYYTKEEEGVFQANCYK